MKNAILFSKLIPAVRKVLQPQFDTFFLKLHGKMKHFKSKAIKNIKFKKSFVEGIAPSASSHWFPITVKQGCLNFFSHFPLFYLLDFEFLTMNNLEREMKLSSINFILFLYSYGIWLKSTHARYSHSLEIFPMSEQVP